MEKQPKPSSPLEIHRFSQISESHCGPAVVQMLLQNLGIGVDQMAVAERGGATETIETDGMRIDQLALAVRKLAPGTLFWSKDKSSLTDIEALLNAGYPVGVEWQGLFENPDEEAEAGEADYGHYSVVTHVDRAKASLIIVDPYRDYVDRDRIIDISRFINRWWDTNAVIDPRTGAEQYVEDDRMLFVITQKPATVPRRLGMIPNGTV